LVLGRGGGVLQPLALAARLGAAAVLGDGRQWQSWIHLDDLVGLIAHALRDEALAGPFNAVAPEPLTQRQFTAVLAATLKRPVLLRMPAALLRGLAGEMSALFLLSQRVLPERALQQGFTFRWRNAGAALQPLLCASTAAPAGTVYVNEACPVCRAGMDAYERLAGRGAGDLRFRPIGGLADGLDAYGLSARDLRRRLFVRTDDGAMLSGIDAVAALWRRMPGVHPRLAALLQLPGLRGLADFVYELLLAPALSAWNERRLSRRA
ncbi:MAG: DUF1731 domain-containing protein, partial [Solimonas sp.]